MKFTTKQFLVLESIFTNATVTLGEVENYFHIIEAMKEAQQLDSNTIEVNFDFDDLQLFHKFVLATDFKVKDINFVIELISLLGMVDLIKPSIKRLRGVFMWSDYKYVGKESLSIIVKGICTTIMPGDRIKKFYLSFFMKQYRDKIELIEEPITSVDIPMSMPAIESIITQPLEQGVIVEESIPTPILEEPVVTESTVETTSETEASFIAQKSFKKTVQKSTYPYMFKGKAVNHALDVKALLKEELQTLAIELGIPSDGKVRELRGKINELLIKK